MKTSWLIILLGAAYLAAMGASVAQTPNNDRIVEYFKHQRGLGQYKACQANLKNIGTACEMFSTDHKGAYPGQLREVTPNYLRNIPQCPAAGADTYSASYRTRPQRDSFSVVCLGNNHAFIGIPQNFPQINSEAGLNAPVSPFANEQPPPGAREIMDKVAPGMQQRNTTLSRLIDCQSNLKNIGTACEMFATDHKAYYPQQLGQLAPNYLRVIPTCPAARADTYSRTYHAQGKDDYQVCCGGNNHPEKGPNRPAYSGRNGLQSNAQ